MWITRGARRISSATAGCPRDEAAPPAGHAATSRWSHDAKLLSATLGEIRAENDWKNGLVLSWLLSQRLQVAMPRIVRSWVSRLAPESCSRWQMYHSRGGDV